MQCGQYSAAIDCDGIIMNHQCIIDGCHSFICSLCNPVQKTFHGQDNIGVGNFYVCYGCYIIGGGPVDNTLRRWCTIEEK